MDANSVFPSKFLRAADIDGGPLVVTITDINLEMMQDGATKPVLTFRETQKKLVSNKVNWNTCSKLFGTETDNWRGKRIALFKTIVDFKGESVDTIRVRQAPTAVEQQEALLDEDLNIRF